ncbi:MAG: HAMP domain-containing protein [Firmicutes bacterium]|nr:HAMP domain-containing protein [Bacillota bacterium]
MDKGPPASGGGLPRRGKGSSPRRSGLGDFAPSPSSAVGRVLRALSTTGAWVRYLFQAANSVGLAVKIMGIALILTLLLGGVTTLEVRSTLQKTLAGELEQRGVSIARDVAARSQDLLLTNNLFALHRLVTDTLGNNRDVRYVFILDGQGQIVAHTFGDGFPAALISANSVRPGERVRLESFRTEEGIIHDVAVPVLEGRAGVVRVGLTERSLMTTMSEITARLLASILIVSILGIVAAFLLTKLLTSPIHHLVEATRAVAAGDFKRKAVVSFHDEIGRLAHAFNLMTNELEISYRELEESKHRVVRQIIEAQEEERRRIARELHDETSQSLTSLMVGLKLVEEARNQEEGRVRLEELRKLVGKTLREVHDLARQLRPSALDDLGLVEALSRYIAEFRGKSGLDVIFEVTGNGARRLPPEVETSLYRIVQEALTNVLKHARARRVDVILESRPDQVSLIVEDDGSGFEVTGKVDGDPPWLRQWAPEGDCGLGLFGMWERATLVSGTFNIESQRGSGTTLFVRIPLGKNDSPEVLPCGTDPAVAG